MRKVVFDLHLSEIYITRKKQRKISKEGSRFPTRDKNRRPPSISNVCFTNICLEGYMLR